MWRSGQGRHCPSSRGADGRLALVPLSPLVFQIVWAETCAGGGWSTVQQIYAVFLAGVLRPVYWVLLHALNSWLKHIWMVEETQ